MTITTYDFVHLVLLAAGGKIQGRTKLQKTVYFVGALTGDLIRLGYRPHYYGPYSADVAGAVQELRGLKFLEQRTSSQGSTDDKGFEIARYDYTLTAEGKQIAEDKAKANPKEWEKIQSAMEQLISTRADDYVKLAIAAKTHLVTQQAGEVVPPDTLRTLTSKHGWSEFTPAQYDEALGFLNATGLLPKQTSS